jgi:glycosyltransferase involved in cell wall biosynthesis
VLIIAETSIPQCLKYRVVQKQEAFRRLGIDCTWLSWTDAVNCRALLQTRSHAIFYRVPAHQAVLGLIDEAKRLGVTTAWETDDLIFDDTVVRESRALARLDRKTVASLLQGAALYRRAMLACDAAIASTPGLAEAMRRAGMPEVHVVENGLDEQTLDVTAAVAARRKPAADDHLVRIVYGSGTNTHDVDFEEAATAIGRILDRFPQVRLRLIGPVAIPVVLAPHTARIERLPATGYESYLGLLGECDISIAPLEDYVFNDAKSNIKYLEAAAIGLPSVCSPRAAFAAAITDGVDGFLCAGDDAWESALGGLLTDPGLRRRVGEAARAGVRWRYAPERIASRQVAALVRDRRGPAPLRMLSVNIF